MRKAILKKFIQLLFLALALNTFIFYVVTSSMLLKKTRSNMMFALETADSLFDYSDDLQEQAGMLKKVADMNQSRFTIVKKDGTVEVDTEVSNAAAMENHMEREEVKEALQYGSGHSIRKSETLGIQMLYVARMSSNGEYIFRLASPYSGMQEYLIMLLPAVLLSFAIAFFASSMEAERFSQSITRPLQDISREMMKVDGDYADLHFDRCPYQEINVIADTTTKMSRNVKEYLERLEQEKQIRQEFFSNASHELKTPITSIRGYVELLESGMADLLEETVSSLATQAAERGVVIHKQFESFAIRADLRQMNELCMNLIGNAVKYNNTDGEIWVEARRENTDFVLTVRDSGVGIPQESLNRIFERFYRVDKGRSRKQGGTGLGLAIVKHVVNYYHGTVRVESEIGKGSTFTVRLPVAVQP